MNIYKILKELAKSSRAQNLFFASKEINSIKLFDNDCNLSALQEMYLNLLYHYDNLSRDIITDNISKKVLENDLYEDAYCLWKKEKKPKQKKDNKKSDVYLTVSNKIKFPKKEDK